MKKEYLNIYNNLIKLTRNKNLYINLEKKDIFSDRLIILFFHLGFLLKRYKSSTKKEKLQNLFDFIIRQIDISLREIGYGDASINKKMKVYINLFYSILNKIESWENTREIDKKNIIGNYLNTKKNSDFYVDYFEKYRFFLINNTLNTFTKDIINFKF